MNAITAWRTNRYLVPGIIATLLTGLVIATVIGFFYERERNDGDLMLEHLSVISRKMNEINKTCEIISFDHQKNPINFLNVGSFLGSEVGPVNLVYPDKWEGPYLPDNFTMHGHEYIVVRTEKGHWIMPGVGVKLPNGKTVGVDIELPATADIEALSHDPDALMYGGRSLAIKLPIHG